MELNAFNYNCKICGAIFLKELWAKEHKSTHINFCNKTTKGHSKNLNESTEQEREILEENKFIPITESKRSKKHHCEICFMVFELRVILNEHMKENHQVINGK
ncbi:hypothetical protein PVAND_016996 [Polypedilum vanderplanki]|uniref:C2H2-type domain-containing protein n=1 Tax=Polypedilum vanderplanki TaxID=319348 RepID=A0A9J6BHU5_POLVA|nr:hypothetical protein PVAND_016996 [Polypedilum vanderplanki]